MSNDPLQHLNAQQESKSQALADANGYDRFKAAWKKEKMGYMAEQ